MARDRSARRERRAARSGGLRQAPWRQPTNPYRPTEVLTADQVEVIHSASLRILSDTGMDFLHPEALVILAEAGAS
jgi:trimethylamine---corrinoid protein Co-methyltransferase